MQQSMLYCQMHRFNPANIDESNFHLIYDKMKSFNDAVRELMEGIFTLLICKSDSLSPDRVKEWEIVQSITEKDSKEYEMDMYRKAHAVKKTLVPSFPSTGPSMAQSQSQVTTSKLENDQMMDEI